MNIVKMEKEMFLTLMDEIESLNNRLNSEVICLRNRLDKLERKKIKTKTNPLCRPFDKLILATGKHVEYDVVPDDWIIGSSFVSCIKCHRFVRKAIRSIMRYPENHNFWLTSRRYYIHKGDNVWIEMKSHEFFPKLRIKIWRYYRITLMRFLTMHHVDPIVIGNIEDRLCNMGLSCTNNWIEEELEQYKPLLKVQFDQRIPENKKVDLL